MSVLQQNVIRVLVDGAEKKLSLVAVLAGLAVDRIAGFPALRAHQRHAWHAFLVQCAAMAMNKTKTATLPVDEAEWRTMLLALTSGEAAETAWSLVAPPDRPALLQPPIPDGLAALKKTVLTPDGIDMLVTSRNHDLKQASMGRPEADDWLFALLTLQTMEGFLGAGNYGISRMNGGFASRPALGVAPTGGPGAHFRRDVERLTELRPKISSAGPYAPVGGLGLVWLTPWDGTDMLKPSTLDPYYIEICRRIRLVQAGGEITALAGSSKCARIQPTEGGVTGDPWAPVRQDKDGSLKVFTLDAAGFSYRRIVDLLFEQNGFKASALQEVAATDAPAGLVLVARGLVRGQGKTEGYHERIVPLSNKVRRGPRLAATDPVADRARDRVQMAGEVQRRVLKPALLSLFQNGPDQVNYGDESAGRKAEPFLADFDRLVDAGFFQALWAEVECESEADRIAARTAWLRTLLHAAEAILRRVDTAAPKSSHRHFRALSHALDLLGAAPWRNETLKSWMPTKPAAEIDDAA